MQIKSVLFLLVIGAVAVLAKKGSSEEKNGRGKGSNRNPNRYPQGRPFQVQSPTTGRFPPMSSLYPQQPGSMMQRPPSFAPQGNQNPFGQFPGFSQQQQPTPSTYPGYSSFQSPYLGSSQLGYQPPTQAPFGTQSGSQYPFGNQSPFGTQSPTGSQFPFSQFLPMN